MLQAWTFAMSFEIRSRIRPGVATTTWTGLSKRRMSSRKSVPPVVAKTLQNSVILVEFLKILPESTVFSHFDTDLRCLKSQFTSWYQNQALDIWAGSINTKNGFNFVFFVWNLPFNKRNQIGSRFTSSIFGTGKNIATGKSYWDWSFLNWGWYFPSKQGM